MKKLLLIGTALALFSCEVAPAFATTSTVNPNVPAQGSSLSSSTLRANFLAAYNDITNLWASIASLSASLAPSATIDTTNASNISTGTLNSSLLPSLPAGKMPAFTGDISTSAGSTSTTLATVNGNAGSFGSASSVPSFTVNGKGLITAASSTPVSIGTAQITGLAPSAYTDTTNATNITSGTLSASRIPTLNQNTTGQAGTVATISGLLSAGTNVTLSGAGTSGSPYVINSSGGGGMTYPGAGIANSMGTAWGTSYGISGSGSVALTNSPIFTTPNIGAATGSVSGSAASFTGSLVGDVTGTQGATAISATTVTGKALTGYAATTGTVSATDSILTAINKIVGNFNARVDGVSSVFSRTGAVVATSGDYSVAQITGAAPLASPTFTGTITTPVTGSTQCVHVSSTGVLSGTGSDCGAGGGGSGTVTSSTAGQVAYYGATGTTVVGTSAITVASGFVGIGTATPTATLTVVGTASATAFSGSGASLTGIGTASFSATGTANSTTYLRGDNTWATVAGGSSLNAYSAGTSYVAGNVVVGSDNNFYKAVKTTVGNNPVGDGGTNWNLYAVQSNITLTVAASGGQFTTPYAAIAFEENAVIGDGAVVTISISNGTYTMASAINWTTPYGSQINIVGNTTTPTSVVLNFNNHTNGFFVSGSSVLNINGVYITGTWSTSTTPSVDRSLTALFARGSGSTINATPNVVVSGFYYPVQAAQNGSVEADYMTASQSGDVGFFAYEGGFVSAMYTTCSASGDSVNGLGWCYEAEIGGTIHADYSSATTSLEGGFYANGGNLRAYNSTANGNTGNGFSATRGGRVEVNGSSTANSNGGSGVLLDSGGVLESYNAGFAASSNTGYGVHVYGGGRIIAAGMTMAYNASGAAWCYGGAVCMLGGSVVTGVASKYVADVFGTSYLDMSSWAITTPGNGVVAQLGSAVYAQGNTGSPTLSPSANTVGNSNAYIKQ